jgi:hypothetical protein
MVNRTYFKTVFRMFKGNAARLIIITALVAISVAIVSGISTISPHFRDTFDILRANGREGNLE